MQRGDREQASGPPARGLVKRGAGDPCVRGLVGGRLTSVRGAECRSRDDGDDDGGDGDDSRAAPDKPVEHSRDGGGDDGDDNNYGGDGDDNIARAAPALLPRARRGERRPRSAPPAGSQSAREGRDSLTRKQAAAVAPHWLGRRSWSSAPPRRLTGRLSSYPWGFLKSCRLGSMAESEYSMKSASDGGIVTGQIVAGARWLGARSRARCHCGRQEFAPRADSSSPVASGYLPARSVTSPNPIS